MAVPKRKISRSNTRLSAGAVEDVRVPTGAVPAVPVAEAAARGLPGLRHVQRPSGHRVRREAGWRREPFRPAARWSRRSASPIEPALLRRALDPPLVRVRERRAAHQRAAGVPRRRGARAGDHHRALPQPPGPTRGRAGQAARQRGQHAGARRGGPRSLCPVDWEPTCCSARARRPPAARDKSSILADTLEALLGAIYLEHGIDRRRGDPQAVRPAAGRRRRRGAGLDWKTSLQELTAARALGVPEYQVESPAPTTPRPSPPGWSWPAAGTAGRPAAARRKPSSGRPRRPGDS